MSTRHVLAAFAATSILAAMPLPAESKSIELHRSGYWTTYFTTGSNTPICGMRADFGHNGRRNGALIVKMIKDEPALLLHVFKDGWRIPDGVAIPLYMTFDRSQPFSATGHGVDSGKLNYVQFTIAQEFTKTFLNLFTAANSMTLGFKEGTEPPWTTDMRGSREAVAAFAQCILTMAGAGSTATQPHGNGATQPYGNSGTTQPFSSTPQPRQPPPPPRKPAVKPDDGSV